MTIIEKIKNMSENEFAAYMILLKAANDADTACWDCANKLPGNGSESIACGKSKEPFCGKAISNWLLKEAD